MLRINPVITWSGLRFLSAVIGLRATLSFLPEAGFLFEPVQDDLDKFIHYYNFKRTNQGYKLKGKIPYQKFLGSKRKYTLPEPL